MSEPRESMEYDVVIVGAGIGVRSFTIIFPKRKLRK
jgi:hypothetical protein